MNVMNVNVLLTTRHEGKKFEREEEHLTKRRGCPPLCKKSPFAGNVIKGSSTGYILFKYICILHMYVTLRKDSENTRNILFLRKQ